jgi:hypothetical protein
MGQLKVVLLASDFAFALVDLDRDNLVPLVLIREEDALDFAFRFAAIGHLHNTLRLGITQDAIKRERESAGL